MFNLRTAASPMSARAWWWALGACVVVPIVVWWQSVGDLRVYIDYRTPPGQTLYVLSRLAGLYALFLSWLQIVFGLVRQADDVARRSGLAFHRWLGFTVLGCAILHVALFIAAASLRAGHVALGILAPDFTGFYATAVTLGLFGFYGIVIVAVTGILRAAGYSGAARLHYAATPVFACTFLHSLLIGTETRAGPVLGVYTLMGVTLLGSYVYRWRALRAKPAWTLKGQGGGL